MQVVVAGSHGLLGTALVRHLSGRGHHVRRLVRREATSTREIGWDPAAGRLDPEHLRGTDAVVNLGGVGVGDRRWTASYRRAIHDSRVRPTALLAGALAELGPEGPRVLLQGSAVGFYGDRGEETLTEESTRGTGFLADVVVDWEAATTAAEAAGVRVAHLRTGIVLSRRGGSFGRLLPLLRLGVGGSLGNGRNIWSWITLTDHVRAMDHLLTAPVAGPVNLTAPEPAPQGDLVRAVAEALHRPAFVRVPAPALRLALGGLADDILSSQRAVPTALRRSGFAFQHPDVVTAAAWLAAPR